MKAEPQKQHQWLHRLVGEWTAEMEAAMGPGEPVQKTKGRERVRSLGGLWVICEGEGEMPGAGAVQSVLTLGFDPTKKCFVGTFIASMMSYLWNYDGALAGNVLTLDAEGPSMKGDGSLAKYHDIITMLSDDERTLTSEALGDDGKYHQFMTARYRRVR
jgi:hypothetical protein